MENVIYDDGHRVVRRVPEKQPTKGGAHAFYEVVEKTPVEGVTDNSDDLDSLQFQYDTIEAVGVQGWTNEALLAVLKDRLEGFQAGPFPCKENADALDFVESALVVLERRTADRRARGVEGKHEA